MGLYSSEDCILPLGMSMSVTELFEFVYDKTDADLVFLVYNENFCSVEGCSAQSDHYFLNLG